MMLTGFLLAAIMPLMVPVPAGLEYLDGDGEGWFTIYRENNKVLVSANKLGAPADAALEKLAQKMGWRLYFSSERVRSQLSLVSLDLAFGRQPPRIVAHLIAVSGGVDAVFDDSDAKVALHVVPAPTGATENGRVRLRKWAIHWYGQFLADDPALALDPLVQENGMQTLMHLGKLLLDSGDLEGAVEVYNKVYEKDESHDYVPFALLRLTQAHYELGTSKDTAPNKRKGQLEEAEKSARRLTYMNPRLKTTARATILLGKILMELGRHSECVKILEASTLRLSSAPEIVDIYLLIANAYSFGELPSRVLKTLEVLYAARSYKEWKKRQWLDYHILRGLASELVAGEMAKGQEKTDLLMEGMESLELFISFSSGDLRRGKAFVGLGRVYLAMGKYLGAKAASIEAIQEKNSLDRRWLQAARILEAKTALALGETESAFTKLETVVRHEPEQVPRLVLFLVDTLIGFGRYDRAASIADLLALQTGQWGDRARTKKVIALWKQARKADSVRGFPEQAIKIAQEIEDKDLQSTVAEIIGQAYEVLNMVEKAADAYRGRLR